MTESKVTKRRVAEKFWTCKFLRNFKHARAMKRKEDWRTYDSKMLAGYSNAFKDVSLFSTIIKKKTRD